MSPSSPDPSRLGRFLFESRPLFARLGEKIVQLAGSNGLDQGADDRREFVLRQHHDAGLPFLELDRLSAKLDRHHDLAGRVGLPPGLDPLLADGDLLLAVDFGGPVNCPDVAGVFEKLFLLLQLGDELGPPDMDRIIGVLGQCGERKGLQDGHLGSPLVGQTQSVLTSRTCL